MRIRSVAMAGLVLAACGDDGSGPNGMPDAAPPLTYPISFEVRGDVPLYLAVADADFTWTPVATNASNMYMVETTNRHGIAIACGNTTDGYFTQIELRTRFDEEPFLFCFNGVDTGSTTLAISGDMMQPGQVSMQDTDMGTTSPWTFDLEVESGLHDLIAFGESMVLVRRDVNVTAAATLPAIDVAQGAAYETTVLLVSNLESDETAETESTIFTGNDVAFYARPGTTLYELPSSLSEVTDFFFADFSATSPTSRRSSSFETGGGTPMVTLMPRLTGITFTETGATWADLPDSTASIRVSWGDATNSIGVSASGGYLAGPTELAVTLDASFDAYRVNGTSAVFTANDDEFGSTSLYAQPTSARQAPVVAGASRLRMDHVRRARNAAADAARARR